jgi:hypothetical protein
VDPARFYPDLCPLDEPRGGVGEFARIESTGAERFREATIRPVENEVPCRSAVGHSFPDLDRVKAYRPAKPQRGVSSIDKLASEFIKFVQGPRTVSRVHCVPRIEHHGSIAVSRCLNEQAKVWSVREVQQSKRIVRRIPRCRCH